MLVPFAQIPVFSHYIRLICRATGEQFPVGHAQKDAFAGLALRTPEDYDAAIVEAKNWVLGHSEAIDKYLGHVRDTVLLRQQLQGSSDERPLLSLLLCGATGIGKKYLARVLGRLIFLDGTDQVWEIDKLGGDPATALFGARGAPGPMTSSLSRQPFQTIILENIESANGPLLEMLRAIMQQGMITDPATGRQISFRNTILVLTTTKCSEQLKSLEQKSLTDAEWHSQAIGIVAGETGLSQVMLNCLGDFIPLESPSPITKAEVISVAMKRECNRYGVNLEYVAPELLVQEISQIGDTEGFALLDDRVKKILQRPLLEAATKKKKRMLLKARPLN